MNAGNLNGEFKDPLFSRIEDSSRGKSRAVHQSKHSLRWWIVLLPMAVVLAALIFYLADSRKQIAQLHTEVRSSQDRLTTVSQELEASQGEIGELHEGISNSQSQISEQRRQIRKYRTLYTGLKSQQERQTQHLEAVHRNKAERSEVQTLKTKADEISRRVQQANSNIADLRDVSSRNRHDIQSQESSIGQLQSQVATTEEQLWGLKNKVERAYYPFEISERSGFMKTLDVALRLRAADFRKQRYDLDIFAGRKRIRKKKHPINEPIYFYVDGFQQPYEILVNRVEKTYVVGHLSVPKSRNP